jgi:hypothetical protein
MDLNFPVFATGVRIFRASNDVGPLISGSWVHTNIRNKNIAYGWLKMGERFDPKCEVRC